jgi:hypothetical protein
MPFPSPSLLTTPGGTFKGALIIRSGMHRIAVRDDHVFERKFEERTQRRQRSFQMPWRPPDSQLPSWRCEPVGKN